ncbi:MAG: hypothetical protein AABM29_03245 [Actinomycetota bacterium]
MAAKQPHHAANPKVVKQPARGVPDPDDVVKDKPISWGFYFVDLGGKWSWRDLDPEHAEELHRELSALEGKTLHELGRQKKVKEIPVAHMRLAARQRLKQTGREEADTLYELRLPHKWRVWGLVEQAVFYLLWWDEFETACGHPPKDVKRQ